MRGRAFRGTAGRRRDQNAYSTEFASERDGMTVRDGKRDPSPEEGHDRCTLLKAASPSTVLFFPSFLFIPSFYFSQMASCILTLTDLKCV